uniref:Uncharacterized protein n=1 Tax=Bracon brevicornis TaxID=1563983 RepID=A0A6V7MFT2_9HYME
MKRVVTRQLEFSRREGEEGGEAPPLMHSLPNFGPRYLLGPSKPKSHSKGSGKKKKSREDEKEGQEEGEREMEGWAHPLLYYYFQRSSRGVWRVHA